MASGERPAGKIFGEAMHLSHYSGHFLRAGFQPKGEEDACRLQEHHQDFVIAQKNAARNRYSLCYTLEREAEQQ